MTRRLLQGASILATFALGSAACSPAPENAGAELDRSIVGGDLDTGHNSVFGMVIRDGEAATSCTATLLAPNLLLTARHCVSQGVEREVICGQAGFGETHPAEQVFVTNAPQFRATDNWRKARQIFVPSEGDDTCGFDVALVVLATNVSNAIAQPSVPRIDAEVVQGEPYVAVGYGVSDDGRSGNRMVRSGLSVGCGPGSCGFGVQGTEFVGDTGVCEGDSGGPALDAAGKVVGVVSRGAENCSFPIYASVSAWREFIFEVAIEAAHMGGYPVPFWVTSGSSDPPPEPEPVPKAGIGGACSKPSDCVTGATCEALGSSGSPSCVAICSSSQACSPGQSCEALRDGGASICIEALPPAQGRDEIRSTCAFGVAPARSSAPFGAICAGLLLALHRRRTTSRPVERS
jgi:hypothetical protein